MEYSSRLDQALQSLISGSTPVTNDVPVHYSSSHEQKQGENLLKRLQTFSRTVWFAKPDNISPLACASHGWQCAGADLLQCDACKQKLAFFLPEQRNSDVYNRIISEFKNSLSTAHSTSCPWRKQTTTPALLDHLKSNASLLDEFNLRRKSLQQLDHLPDVTTDSLVSTIPSDLLQQAFATTSPQTPQTTHAPVQLSMDQKCAILASLGWDLDMLPHPPVNPPSVPYFVQHLAPTKPSSQMPMGKSPYAALVCCRTCKAQAGLWTFLLQQFQNKQVAQQNSASSSLVAKTASSSFLPGSAEQPLLTYTIAGAPLPTTSWTWVRPEPTVPKPSLSSSHAVPRFGAVMANTPVFGLEAFGHDGPSTQAEGAGGTQAVMLSQPLPPKAGPSTKRPRYDEEEADAEELIASSTEPAIRPPNKRLRSQQDPPVAVTAVMQPLDFNRSAGRAEFDPVKLHEQWCPWVLGEESRAHQVLQLLVAGGKTRGDEEEQAGTELVEPGAAQGDVEMQGDVGGACGDGVEIHTRVAAALKALI